MLIRKSAGDRIYIEDLNDHDAALRRLARPSGASSGPGGLGVPSGGRSRVFKGPAIIALAWNNTGAALPIYGVAQISGWADTSGAAGSRQQQVLHLEAAAAGGAGLFVVCAEAIPSGAVGPVFSCGVTLALVNNPNNLPYCDITAGQNYLTGQQGGTAQILPGTTFSGATAVAALIRFPVPSHSVQMTVVSVYADYIACTDPNGNAVNVLKPWLLCESSTNPRNGETYTYTNPYTRTVTGANTGTEVITQSYQAGDILYAEAGCWTQNAVAFYWRDTNADGRSWVQQ